MAVLHPCAPGLTLRPFPKENQQQEATLSPPAAVDAPCPQHLPLADGFTVMEQEPQNSFGSRCASEIQPKKLRRTGYGVVHPHHSWVPRALLAPRATATQTPQP